MPKTPDFFPSAMGDPTALRDDFAKVALQGMLAHSTRYKPRVEDQDLHWHDAIAKEAYEIGEAMVRARLTTETQRCV